MPAASMALPITPSMASTSRTRTPFPRPPIAGLQDISPIMRTSENLPISNPSPSPSPTHLHPHLRLELPSYPIASLPNLRLILLSNPILAPTYLSPTNRFKFVSDQKSIGTDSGRCGCLSKPVSDPSPSPSPPHVHRHVHRHLHRHLHRVFQ